MMKKSIHNIMNYIRWCFIIFVILVFVYFIVGELLMPADTFGRDYKCEELKAQWSMVQEDGTRVAVDVPGRMDVARGDTVVVETLLPMDIEDNEYLCFRNSKQDMNVYIDGQLRYEHISGSNRIFGKNGAVVYIFLKLEAGDAGKLFTLTSRTDSAYSGMVYTVWRGDVFGIWRHFFSGYGSELIVAFLTLFLGVASVIGSAALRLHYHRDIELEYLGWGVLLSSVWLITNSVFRQLIFPNLAVINDIAFFMVMLLPFPFNIYMNAVQKRRYEKWYMMAGIISVIDFLLCTFLHVFRIKDFTDTFIYIAANCIIVIIIMGATIIYDIFTNHVKEYILAAIGVLGACVAAGIQIFTYFGRANEFNGVIMALGLVFLLIISVVNTIREILEMENTKQQAVSASEAKARFLAHMSHEIRTPINAVLGMDAMILRESKDSGIKEYALDIQNAGRSLLSIVNDILDFSKIESGKMELVCVEYDLSSMIHDIFNMSSMRAEAKDLKLHIYIDENLPSHLYGDDIRIRQILINLMNNAVKYTDKGMVSLSVAGEVHEDILLMHFEVRDTGIGIKKEDISKLFAEFERIEEKRNRNIEGTGLGMSITVRLLKMMGSELSVDSEYGKGSCFSFDLEQKIIDYEPIGNLEERIRKQTDEYVYNVAFKAPAANILVVDDNSVNRRVFKNLLKETEVHIEEAANGEECLEMVRSNQYDIIFLDHMMPDMDGIDVIRAMHEYKEDYPCKNTPVVALTANAIVGAKEMYLEAGFDEFLSKPIVPEKLENMIMRLLPDDKFEIQKNDDLYSASDSNIGKSHNTKNEPLQNGDTDSESDELPNISGINWEYSMVHIKDRRLLWDTVSDFYELMNIEADTLQQLYDALLSDNNRDEEFYYNLKQYKIKVHSMKSSAATIGAVALSGVASLLEQAALDERLNDIHNITPLFIKEWISLQERLSTYFEKSEKPECADSMDEIDDIGETFAMLQDAMNDMDIDEADRIMKYLLQFTYPEPFNDYIEKMKGAVTNLDAEQVGQIIRRFVAEKVGE